jgi:hypothetical protein
MGRQGWFGSHTNCQSLLVGRVNNGGRVGCISPTSEDYPILPASSSGGEALSGSLPALTGGKGLVQRAGLGWFGAAGSTVSSSCGPAGGTHQPAGVGRSR